MIWVWIVVPVIAVILLLMIGALAGICWMGYQIFKGW